MGLFSKRKEKPVPQQVVSNTEEELMDDNSFDIVDQPNPSDVALESERQRLIAKLEEIDGSRARQSMSQVSNRQLTHVPPVTVLPVRHIEPVQPVQRAMSFQQPQQPQQPQEVQQPQNIIRRASNVEDSYEDEVEAVKEDNQTNLILQQILGRVVAIESRLFRAGV